METRKQRTRRFADLRMTLAELCDAVLRALSDYQGPANGQASILPNERALRYYAALGLLDKPAEMRGRTALYGWRHLLQIVALKRLQEQRLALHEIQARLAGLSNTALEDLAQINDKFEMPERDAPATDGRDAPATPRRDSAFWAEAPAPVPPREVPRAVAQGVHLENGALLLLTGAPAFSPSDLDALRTAAAPLLEELRKRGWTT